MKVFRDKEGLSVAVLANGRLRVFQELLTAWGLADVLSAIDAHFGHVATEDDCLTGRSWERLQQARAQVVRANAQIDAILVSMETSGLIAPEPAEISAWFGVCGEGGKVRPLPNLCCSASHLATLSRKGDQSGNL